jgi:uncharacterized protein (TIGR03437 family)
VSAASFLPGAAIPGSLISLFGLNFAQGNAAGGLPWPTTLEGVALAFNGVAAPLNFVSASQINAQVPWELSSQQSVQLAVNANGLVGCAATSTSTALVAPAIFSVNGSGKGQGAILIANTATLAAPAGPGSTPATAGDYLSIFATGLGPVSNTPASGAAAGNPLGVTQYPPVVTIGGVNAPVTFSGLAPGFVGLYQVNVQVPANTPKGDAIAVVLRSLSLYISNTVTIAVQ